MTAASALGCVLTSLHIPAGTPRRRAVCAGLWWAGEQPFFGADSFFAVRVGGLTVSDAWQEDAERAALNLHRWWTAVELKQTADAVFPLGAAGVLRQILAGGLPARPVWLPWPEHRVAARP